MEDRDESVDFEEVFDNEIDDIWDIFFPYMTERKESLKRLEEPDQKKPRRYLKFLTMCF